MRFAYIDSGGNEVPIPSVDALALRIELGAVGPDTQLYDAQADHWGPAHTHEIFHTLSRETGQDGFVPPPPAVVPTPPPPAPSAAPSARPASPEPPKKPAKPTPKVEKSVPGSALDLGLTLADPPPESPAATAQRESALDFTLDLAAPPPETKPQSVAGARPDEPPASFDFGDLGAGGLESEASAIERGLPSPGGGFVGGDLALETPMDFTSGVASDADDLRLEVAGSNFGSDGPASGWAADTSAGGDVMDFSSAAAGAPPRGNAPLAPAAAPVRPPRSVKNRPSPPKFRKQRSTSGPIVLVVLVLALGVGGYVGWPLLSARFAAPPPEPAPAPSLPVIPRELLPRMRELAAGAIADLVAEADRATAAGAPPEPDPQWLRGNYLANASQFAGIETFWMSIGQLVDAVREAEGERLSERLAQRAERERIPADTAALLIERAEAGFVAAAAARRGVYAAFDRLVDAALELHGFLVQNDASIEYRPASVSTADPILEAVPASPAIGAAMEQRIGGYTGALDGALGSIDRVSRARLISALSTRLQQIGIE
jgi:hypothetical protein